MNTNRMLDNLPESADQTARYQFRHTGGTDIYAWGDNSSPIYLREISVTDRWSAYDSPRLMLLIGTPVQQPGEDEEELGSVLLGGGVRITLTPDEHARLAGPSIYVNPNTPEGAAARREAYPVAENEVLDQLALRLEAAGVGLLDASRTI